MKAIAKVTSTLELGVPFLSFLPTNFGVYLLLFIPLGRLHLGLLGVLVSLKFLIMLLHFFRTDLEVYKNIGRH